MKSLFLKLDFLGHVLGFENDESFRYNTSQGAIISVLLIICTTAISLIFGQELYQRKNPSVTTSKEIVNNTFISLNELPIILTFHDSLGNEIKDFSTIQSIPKQTR